MAINTVLPHLLSNATPDGGTAANESYVGYTSANGRVEYISISADTTDRDTVNTNLTNFATQLDANVNTISSNASTLVVGVDAAEASLDTVSSNIDTFATYGNANFLTDSTASNTFIRVNLATTTANNTITGNVTANVVSDTLTFTAGNGISFTANSDAQSLTITGKLDAIVNDRFVADGTANTFTLFSKPSIHGNDLIVAVDGVVQVFPNNYTVSGTTLTIANTLPIRNGTVIDVRHLPISGSDGTIVGLSPSFSWQGTASGYISGGIDAYTSGPPWQTYLNNIQKWPLTSDTNSTDIADLARYAFSHSGHSSSTHAYTASIVPDWTSQPSVPGTAATGITKFPFSSDTDSTLLNGSLTGTWSADITRPANGWSSETYGYMVQTASPRSAIQKFPFSSDTDSSPVGNMFEIVAAGGASSQSSTHAYTSSAGYPDGPASDTISKFPFSSDTNATDVAELALTVQTACGLSSSTYGYVIAGAGPVNYQHMIQKFPFSSDSPASDIGELGGASARQTQGSTGISGENAGYAVGGRNASNVTENGMFKVIFSSDTPAPNSGTLAVASAAHAGHHA